eukprot:GHVQ01023382.1.p1 GENE.GHVQ01023382.1~~GHVQ01023382.1.p1  ORF type:complete len:1900 (-),score=221.50 GHVQ01023382.1:138-5288(-)
MQAFFAKSQKRKQTALNRYTEMAKAHNKAFQKPLLSTQKQTHVSELAVVPESAKHGSCVISSGISLPIPNGSTVSTAEACSTACRKAERCQWWSFLKTSSSCSLHASAQKIIKDTDCISGWRFYDKWPLFDLENFGYFIDFFFQAFQTDDSEYREISQKAKDAKNQTQKQQVLANYNEMADAHNKDVASTENEKGAERLLHSPVSEGLELPLVPESATHGTAVSSFDSGQIKLPVAADSGTQCSKACKRLEECHWWTFNRVQGTCSLFKFITGILSSTDCSSGWQDNEQWPLVEGVANFHLLITFLNDPRRTGFRNFRQLAQDSRSTTGQQRQQEVLDRYDKLAKAHDKALADTEEQDAVGQPRTTTREEITRLPLMPESGKNGTCVTSSSTALLEHYRGTIDSADECADACPKAEACYWWSFNKLSSTCSLYQFAQKIIADGDCVSGWQDNVKWPLFNLHDFDDLKGFLNAPHRTGYSDFRELGMQAVFAKNHQQKLIVLDRYTDMAKAHNKALLDTDNAEDDAKPAASKGPPSESPVGPLGTDKTEATSTEVVPEAHKGPDAHQTKEESVTKLPASETPPDERTHLPVIPESAKKGSCVISSSTAQLEHHPRTVASASACAHTCPKVAACYWWSYRKKSATCALYKFAQKIIVDGDCSSGWQDNVKWPLFNLGEFGDLKGFLNDPLRTGYSDFRELAIKAVFAKSQKRKQTVLNLYTEMAKVHNKSLLQPSASSHKQTQVAELALMPESAKNGSCVISSDSSLLVPHAMMVATARECSTLCRKTKRCQWWSIRKTSYSCSLYTSADKIIKDSDCISGWQDNTKWELFDLEHFGRLRAFLHEAWQTDDSHYSDILKQADDAKSKEQKLAVLAQYTKMADARNNLLAETEEEKGTELLPALQETAGEDRELPLIPEFATKGTCVSSTDSGAIDLEVDADSDEDCSEACKGLEECHWWTFNRTDGSCSLFKFSTGLVSSKDCSSGWYDNEQWPLFERITDFHLLITFLTDPRRTGLRNFRDLAHKSKSTTGQEGQQSILVLYNKWAAAHNKAIQEQANQDVDSWPPEEGAVSLQPRPQGKEDMGAVPLFAHIDRMSSVIYRRLRTVLGKSGYPLPSGFSRMEVAQAVYTALVHTSEMAASNEDMLLSVFGDAGLRFSEPHSNSEDMQQAALTSLHKLATDSYDVMKTEFKGILGSDFASFRELDISKWLILRASGAILSALHGIIMEILNTDAKFAGAVIGTSNLGSPLVIERDLLHFIKLIGSSAESVKLPDENFIIRDIYVFFLSIVRKADEKTGGLLLFDASQYGRVSADDPIVFGGDMYEWSRYIAVPHRRTWSAEDCNKLASTAAPILKARFGSGYSAKKPVELIVAYSPEGEAIDLPAGKSMTFPGFIGNGTDPGRIIKLFRHYLQSEGDIGHVRVRIDSSQRENFDYSQLWMDFIRDNMQTHMRETGVRGLFWILCSVNKLPSGTNQMMDLRLSHPYAALSAYQRSALANAINIIDHNAPLRSSAVIPVTTIHETPNQSNSSMIVGAAKRVGESNPVVFGDFQDWAKMFPPILNLQPSVSIHSSEAGTQWFSACDGASRVIAKLFDKLFGSLGPTLTVLIVGPQIKHTTDRLRHVPRFKPLDFTHNSWQYSSNDLDSAVKESLLALPHVALLKHDASFEGHSTGSVATGKEKYHLSSERLGSYRMEIVEDIRKRLVGFGNGIPALVRCNS